MKWDKFIYILLILQNLRAFSVDEEGKIADNHLNDASATLANLMNSWKTLSKPPIAFEPDKEYDNATN